MITKKPNLGPYNLDIVNYNHKGRLTTSILNSPVFETLIDNIDKAYKYEVGYVPPGMVHRPDLMANEYYGSPSNWWLIMFVNNIADPFESLDSNQQILLPKTK